MIELYAITSHPGPPLPDVAPLREIERDRLSAVIAHIDEEPVATADRLWHHERVVEALMQSRNLLPVRYGTCLPDEDAVAGALDRRREELITALEFVRGAVEVSVRVFGQGSEDQRDASDRNRSGADYLREKARRGHERARAVSAVHEPLRALARADAERPATLDRELLRSAFLVDRPRVATFSRLVAALQASHPGLQLLCTGPWPPYSFAQR